MMLRMIIVFMPFVLLSKSDLTFSSPIVTTNNGLIEGISNYINGKTINTFMGIPFAEPPVGDLRFRKPLPKKRWNGTYDATHIKPQCIQKSNTSVMSEDCLYLNIWSPNLNSDTNLPVMLWIHGGGFYEGSATTLSNGFNVHDGTQLCMKDVIVVTINYRLGIFGYLFGDSDDAPGNMGYWDQVMALNWTKQNIKAFGGNPNDIIPFGQSAGAISISCHILSPITNNMFKKAILQSGSTLLPVVSINRETAFYISREFAKTSSFFLTNACIEDENWIKCLKNKSAEELLYAQFQYIFLKKNPYIFIPIFGDKFLPKDVIKSIKDGDFKKDIKLLIGHTEMEGLSFTYELDKQLNLSGRYNPQKPFVPDITKSQVYNDIILFIPNDTINDEIAKAYTAPFPDTQPLLPLIQNKLRRSATHCYGDLSITCPTILFGAKIANHSCFRGNIYQYRLTYANSKSIAFGSVWANVTHSDDVQLVFGQPLNEKCNNWTKDDKIMSRQMVEIWTHFAKQSSPPLVRGKHWPKYKSSYNGNINLSYVELNPYPLRSGKIHVNRYKGNDGYFPNVINNCIYFWNEFLSNAF